MSRVADRLADALSAAARSAGLEATLGPVVSRPWHSALFSGERHVAELTGPDDAPMTAWLGALPEIELPLPGHVADVAIGPVVRRGSRLTATLEMLTVET